MPSKLKQKTPSSIERPAKRHKPNLNSKKKVSAKLPKAADRGFIPIPADADENNDALSEQDEDVLDVYGNSVAFLDKLDRNGLTRSKKETERLHALTKPVRKLAIDDDLPSIHSHSEDEDDWSSNLDEPSENEVGSDDITSDTASLDSDTEMPYETQPRKQHISPESSAPGLQRLPIKLGSGRILQTGRSSIKRSHGLVSSNTSDDDDEEEEEEDLNVTVKEDVSTAARFGRLAVVDVVTMPSRKDRIEAAKSQIAGICHDILADPENGIGLLRRLHTFASAKISTPSHPQAVTNDPIIRKLAILSQLAVFKDVIPGYRIRSLTEKEQAEKVSQMVARTREWEQGLLATYQNYLRLLEVELKERSELQDLALQCVCTLLKEVTHFNFRVNLMTCVVLKLSKRSWDNLSDLCLQTLGKILRQDASGEVSLEVVRLLNRTVKEKHFNVNPQVLSCLLQLRLKNELGTRASETRAEKEPRSSASKNASRRSKGKLTDQPHLSKKAKKMFKERKEIEREFREAEAEVDKEERQAMQTETLKLLFVLYFRIIKNPTRTPLLPAALEGIAKYAHLVNIDFFKDLMTVLKGLVVREPENGENDSSSSSRHSTELYHRLLCVFTAFELLSGQGEALNIDLADFVIQLYTLIPAVSLEVEFDKPKAISQTNQSLADLMFRALEMVFSPRVLGTKAPTWRSAAFAKRMLTASLHWPPSAAIRALEFVGGLLAKDPKLKVMLSTEDRAFDGIYRPNVDDPQLSNALGTSLWELFLLQDSHSAGVREAARKLLNMAD